ncbi:MAG TPA: hypothetical protein VGM90_14125 [Kofleriaceae bacterium]
MKKPKKKAATLPKVSDALDWAPLFEAFKEAFEWALDVAKGLARDYPEEVEAVERVRSFMRQYIAGDVLDIPVNDVLLTFALIIGAIERDLGPVATLGPWFAPTMRFPGANEFWERGLPMRVSNELRYRRVAPFHFANT